MERKQKVFKAFTLAEVLLILAVIGIAAAITLPSLLVDTTEKRISQCVAGETGEGTPMRRAVQNEKSFLKLL